MALIKCSECKKEISDMADICPHCGIPSKKDEIIQKSADGESQSAVVDIALCNEVEETVKTSKKGVNKKVLVIAGIALILIVIILSAIIMSTTMLLGDDKIACNYILEQADNFKNPESVRLAGGTLSDDKKYLYATISAQNSFGYRVTGCFYISEIGIYSMDGAEFLSRYTSTKELNIDKINKVLEKKLK